MQQEMDVQPDSSRVFPPVRPTLVHGIVAVLPA
jgi:hypothetical protein